MRAWYNEIDTYCCDWLSNLMDAGHIMPGVIDDRSIEDINPDDLRGYGRCHFFAGIAGWDLALQLAGWPADRPVWTGSCPCQPFSGAGRGKAADDERHLWPHWFRLVRDVRPPVVFGEQVEAAVGWGWLDLVCSDLGAQGYAVGAAVLPACGVGAPHIRQRLWFVADSDGEGVRSGPRARAGGEAQAGHRIHLNNSEQCREDGLVADAHRPGRLVERGGRLFDGERAAQRDDIDGRGTNGGMANGAGPRWHTRRGAGEAGGGRDPARVQPGRFCAAGLMGHADLEQFQGCADGSLASPGWQITGRPPGLSGSDAWSDPVWLPCSDGKARPAQPGVFPLAHGIPARVGRLRAYGNAIVPQAAAAFIMSCA